MHVLVTAPTGSGKTLAAFLWALNRFIDGTWGRGATKVLYISPLKALNNDILQNLLRPLEEIAKVFEEAGEPFHPPRVMTRSGDTSQQERRHMQRRPPEILITTPESLNLLLNSPGGRAILSGLATVILDEIHAVFPTKRGTYLVTAVERLVRLSGEFQRIALSATVRPAGDVAAFVGGYTIEGPMGSPAYRPRPVSVISVPPAKAYSIRVSAPGEGLGESRRGEPARLGIQGKGPPEIPFPADGHEGPQLQDFWAPIAKDLRKIIRGNTSTLLFTNSRSLAEKITLRINEGEDEPLAYSHHGSLSREVREAVERKLKAGALKAIVATSSLEMGIDIGALDEVVLIQSPPSVSSAVQRVGRAGHRVGEVSRGAFFPTHPLDYLNAAVLAKMILSHNIEDSRPVECPLDVLAQVIVAMTAVEEWDIDDLYGHLKAAWPFRDLDRGIFDKVLEMLAGRHEESRIRELRPRIQIDRIDNTASARAGALQLIYICGGVIPDRGYFTMRHHKTGSVLGELDEEFVWENPEGSTFTLGMQSWRVERITHNDVFVSPSAEPGPLPPFWKGESTGRDFHLSQAIGTFLEEADLRLDDPAFSVDLERIYQMDSGPAQSLLSFLRRQKEATGAPLPHRHHLLVEHVMSGPQGAPVRQVILHTHWGGRVNRPFALALQAAWDEEFGYPPEAYASDDCVIIISTHEVSAGEILALMDQGRVLSLLRRQLEGSGFFGARFRENARRALLLTPNRMHQRMPLWLSRLRSQALLHAVSRYDDFPILLETWRTCLKDEFDMDALGRVLSELEGGAIQWTEVRTVFASPFAQDVTWEQVNKYMYMDDQPRSSKTSKLRDDLLGALVLSPGLRPAVLQEVVSAFEEKRNRLSPGYSPSTSRDLLEWIKERILIRASEWEALLAAIERDHGVERNQVLEPLSGKVAKVRPPRAGEPLIAAVESLPRIIVSLYGDMEVIAESMDGTPLHASGDSDEENPASVLGEWLQYYGPCDIPFVESALGMSRTALGLYLDELVETQTVIIGVLVSGIDKDQICDSGNFETLLRMTRAAARPAFEALGAEWLQVFLALNQGLAAFRKGAKEADGVFEALERLVCLPLPADLWESEILPTRVPDYQTSWVDTVLRESDLLWFADAGKHVSFCFREDLDLVGRKPHNGGLFLDPSGRYAFSDLLRITGLDTQALTSRLWESVWKSEAANDTFAALRRGILSGFSAPQITEASRSRARGRRAGFPRFSQWKSAAPWSGNWYALAWPSIDDDLVSSEERKKERVRILLDRYGILFRDLLQKEAPPFRWSALFRTLRIMELSGEVSAGCFFEGIKGPQFISPHAFRALQGGLPDEEVYFLNALDPASLCGLGADGLKLPRRVPGTHLVYRGPKLVLISERSGKLLTLCVPTDDPRLREYLVLFRHLLSRSFRPVSRVTIEKINGRDASESPFIPALRSLFTVETYMGSVILM
jgi:ATP-dependent Lhr-like helicase